MPTTILQDEFARQPACRHCDHPLELHRAVQTIITEMPGRRVSGSTSCKVPRCRCTHIRVTDLCRWFRRRRAQLAAEAPRLEAVAP